MQIRALTSQRGIGAEMRSVYRSARTSAGESPSVKDAESLTRILKTISDNHALHELEQRIQALEQRKDEATP